MAPLERETNPMVRLLDGLLRYASSTTLAWQPFNDFAYSLETPSGTVIISSRDQDDAPPFLLEIQTSAGVSESISTGWRDDAQFYDAEPSPMPWNDKLEQLYRIARNAALGLDNAVDGILSFLDPEPF